MKRPIEKMAEYIINSPIDYCIECCADRKSCNEKMSELYKAHEDDKDYDPPMPPLSHCVANIIKFFEQEDK